MSTMNNCEPITALQVALERAERIFSPIPPMTDSLGRYWEQPNRNEIEIDAKSALMSHATFRKLKRYDISLPTGTYPGKMWAMLRGETMWLCWYFDIGSTEEIGIAYRRIIVV